VKDFTQGNIARQVIDFSLPIILGNVLTSVYGIINLIWVGRLLGHKAVAAVGATLPVIMLLPAFLIGLGMATNVMIAQAFGRKDTALLRRILPNSFFASVAFCLFISGIALVFRRELLDLVHTPPEIYGMSLSYLTIMIATLIFHFYINWMNGMLRGLGDAKTVLKILVILTLFNITFVPLLIVGIGPVPPLGVAGAALGSSLAAVVTSVIGYLYLLQYNPYVNVRQWNYSLDWRIIRQVFTIGVPASLQMMVVSLASVFIVALVNRHGAHVTAAFGIGLQIDMLATIPFMSIGIAATSLAGQNLGARRMDRVSETLRTSILFALAIACVCTGALFFFSRDIGAIFLKASADNAAVLDVVENYYHYLAFIFPCFAIIFVVHGVLRSAGDTVALFVLSFLAMFVIRIPLAYLLSGPAGLAEHGIWVARRCRSALAVGFNWIDYEVGRWKKKRILDV